MALRTVAPGLRVVESRVHLPGGFRLPTLTCAIELASGEQLLTSPVAGLARARDELAGVGPVVGLLAPNALHHLALEEALGIFPGAQIHAVARVQRKRPELTFASTLGTGRSPWPELEVIPIDGMPGLNEVALLHRRSRSLLLCDLAFLFDRAQLDQLLWRLLLRFNGVKPGTLSFSRITRRFIRDPAALRRSIDRLLALDFDRVIPAHGAVLETGGREALARAFAVLRA